MTHLAVAILIQAKAGGSLALTALSHVMTFDATGASVCIAVDILGNFDVWARSTVRHPFGLARAEVLAGFAMSVFLVFMGFDIITHTAEHLLEGLKSFQNAAAAAASKVVVEVVDAAGQVVKDEDSPHDHHAHHSVLKTGTLDFYVLAGIAATLVSALALKNHARINRAIQFRSLPLPALLSNPSHLLTLAFSTLILLLPLFSAESYALLDRILALSIAIAMLWLGARLLKSLGSMLLMSMYLSSPATLENLVREIERDPSGQVRSVEECKVWQVHYGLGMANVRVVLNGSSGAAGVDGQVERCRERIQRVVKDALGGGGFGEGSVRWEVSVAVAWVGS